MAKQDEDVNDDVIVQEGFGFVFYGLVSRRAFRRARLPPA